MAQILHGFSYRVCSTVSQKFSYLDNIFQFLGSTNIHQQLVAMLGGHMRLSIF